MKTALAVFASLLALSCSTPKQPISFSKPDSAPNEFRQTNAHCLMETQKAMLNYRNPIPYSGSVRGTAIAEQIYVNCMEAMGWRRE